MVALVTPYSSAKRLWVPTRLDQIMGSTFGATVSPDGSEITKLAAIPQAQIRTFCTFWARNIRRQKFLENGTVKSQTRFGDDNEPSQQDGDKLKMREISITRIEGYTHECVTKVTNTWQESDSILKAWARTAPKGGAYNKCDFVVTFENGETYKGRYDLHFEDQDKIDLLGQHMKQHISFHAGLWFPSHMTREEYDLILHNDEANFPGLREDYLKFWQTHEMGAVNPGKSTMTDQAVDERAGLIEKWLNEGVPPETIQRYADNPQIRSMINALAQIMADEKTA